MALYYFICAALMLVYPLLDMLGFTDEIYGNILEQYLPSVQKPV